MTSVLIVEDDLQFRSALARDLTVQGYQVAVAQSVDEAVGMLAAKPTNILLTDLRIGERDGIDLLGTVREVSPDTRSILMSGYATARDHQRAMELGAVQVLCKPFTATELFNALQQAIECETGFRGSVHGLSLTDVLQMFHFGRRSVVIQVGGRVPGRLFFQDGELIHAQIADVVGEAAFKMILQLPSGSIQTSVFTEAPTTIRKPFDNLLLDSLRTIDEEAVGSESEDQVDDELDRSFAPSSVPPAQNGQMTSQTQSSHPQSPDEIVEKWNQACTTLGFEFERMQAIAFTTGNEHPIVLQGPADMVSDREAVVGLVASVAQLCPDSTTGIFEYVTHGVGCALIWNVEDQFIVMVSNTVQEPSEVAFFRRNITILGRALTQEN